MLVVAASVGQPPNSMICCDVKSSNICCIRHTLHPLAAAQLLLVLLKLSSLWQMMDECIIYLRCKAVWNTMAPGMLQ